MKSWKKIGDVETKKEYKNKEWRKTGYSGE